jgi:hypothetical protein
VDSDLNACHHQRGWSVSVTRDLLELRNALISTVRPDFSNWMPIGTIADGGLFDYYLGSLCVDNLTFALLAGLPIHSL